MGRKVLVNLQLVDLGSESSESQRIIEDFKQKLGQPRGQTNVLVYELSESQERKALDDSTSLQECKCECSSTLSCGGGGGGGGSKYTEASE